MVRIGARSSRSASMPVSMCSIGIIKKLLVPSSVQSMLGCTQIERACSAKTTPTP